MILLGYSLVSTISIILIVSLIVLLASIAYRRLLNKLSASMPQREEYCVLYDLEKNPVVGEMDIYFTSEQSTEVKVVLFNRDFSHHTLIEELTTSSGSHIVRFDSARVPDGEYYFGLITPNQKTMKKCTIANNLINE